MPIERVDYTDFVFGESAELVNIIDLLPVKSEIEFIEDQRRNMVKGYLDALLRDGITKQDQKIFTTHISHLGAVGLLAYFPKK